MLLAAFAFSHAAALSFLYVMFAIFCCFAWEGVNEEEAGLSEIKIFVFSPFPHQNDACTNREICSRTCDLQSTHMSRDQSGEGGGGERN